MAVGVLEQILVLDAWDRKVAQQAERGEVCG